MALGYWKLDLTFDAPALKTEVEKTGTDDWARHFNTGYHDGGWDGIALRSKDGDARSLYTGNNTASNLSDTGFLRECPHLQSVLAAFKCPIQSARILRLKVGASIRQHQDYNTGFDFGSIRIHVPIKTNPFVEFYLDNQRIVMNEGECWYLDISRPHRVNNLGETDRLHLVLDCEVNSWLHQMVPVDDAIEAQKQEQSVEARRAQMRYKRGLDEFRVMILENLPLQQRLRNIIDSQVFINQTLQLAKECGYRFTAADLIAAMSSGRQTGSNLWMIS